MKSSELIRQKSKIFTACLSFDSNAEQLSSASCDTFFSSCLSFSSSLLIFRNEKLVIFKTLENFDLCITHVSILGSSVTVTDDSIPGTDICLELNPAPLTAVIGRAPPPPDAVPMGRFMPVPGTGTAPLPKAIGCFPGKTPPAGNVLIPVF